MTTSKTSKTSKNAPTHFAYQVRDGEQKGYWTRIGAAWAHKDGQGFGIILECVPLDGRISLRVNADHPAQ